MSTPKTKHLRPRHVPTPKMSLRKKSLFAFGDNVSCVNEVIDEDSDLGPMFLLESSLSPKSSNQPAEYDLVQHLSVRRTDFSNLMEQLSPAIKKSCRISQSDDSPVKVITPIKSISTIREETIINESESEKENYSESLLRTPVIIDSNSTITRNSFRRSNSFIDHNSSSISPNDCKINQKRVDSPKAKTSLIFSEISAKSFYGSSNPQPIVHRKLASNIPFVVEKKKHVTSTKHVRRNQHYRSNVRKPILGRVGKISNQYKRKIKLTKLKQSTLLLNQHFNDNVATDFDRAMMSGIISERRMILPNVDISDFCDETDESSEDEQPIDQGKRKFFKSNRSGTQNRYQVTKALSATVKRGHGIKLLSPPKKKAKVMENEYNELFLIQNEVRKIVNRLSKSETTNDYQHNRDNETIQNDLITTTITDDYDKYRQMIPYNTTDQNEIDRQNSVINILISNNICNDENFKIFISEYEQRKAEAEAILNNLFHVSISSEPENDVTTMATVPINDEISELCQDDVTHNERDSTANQETPKYHSIFYKNQRNETKTQLSFLPCSKTMQKWTTIAPNQRQIDAGQKEFGSKNCSQCGMFYTLHDPDDEILHQKFHNSMMGVLNFKGWAGEKLVANIDEWGNNGRIIWVSQLDTKHHLNRIGEILEIINKDLGLYNSQLKLESITYLAITRKQVIGVCVANPLKTAHKMYTENNVDYIDLKEDYPVKCGISRIWVAPQYRRHGVATRLIEAVRTHFIRGYAILENEIAFSAPTMMGKLFAQKITSNVLVYEEV